MAICGRDFFTQDGGWRGGKSQSGRLSGVGKRGQAPRKSSCIRNKRPTADLSLPGPRRPHRGWPSAGTHPATLSRGHTLPFQGLITAGNLLQRVHVRTGFTHRSRARGPKSRPERSGVRLLSQWPCGRQWTCGNVWRQVWLSQLGTEELLAPHGVRSEGQECLSVTHSAQVSWTPAPSAAGPLLLPQLDPSPFLWRCCRAPGDLWRKQLTGSPTSTEGPLPGVLPVCPEARGEQANDPLLTLGPQQG